MEKKKRIVHVGSKWKKTKPLLEDVNVRQYVPKTLIMSAGTLESLLDEFRMVYIKPVHGTYGNGVMRVEKVTEPTGDTRYQYQLREKKRTFASLAAMHDSILQTKRRGTYLVQQGIHLLTYRNRRFDIRVMVQKSPMDVWEATAVIGRLGHPKKIVTNYHSGGIPTPLDKLLSPYMRPEQIAEYETKLKRIGKNAALALSRKYPGLSMIGADIAVDMNHHPWIIELNTHPDPYIFKHLKKPSVYHKVLRYARAMGAIPSRARRLKKHAG